MADNDETRLANTLRLTHQLEDLIARMFGKDSEPARRFGHYEILCELGRGGMGVVYKGRDPRLDRIVAIKKLHGRGNTMLQRRLEREAQVMAKLAHPNVIMIHEIGGADGATFIVMEYVEGVTLRDWLKKHPSQAEILSVFKSAAHGLVAVHEKGLVHRDFKPDNVMLGKDGRVRVMDFGLARVGLSHDEMTSSEVDGEAQQLTSQLTRSGALLGTLPYMAPEQLQGKQANAASDQFAYCVALYEALYRTRPFGGETPAQLLSAIDRASLNKPPQGSAVPAWLHQVVVRGLEAQPRDRFRSMKALLDALDGKHPEDLGGWERSGSRFIC
jgi:serine/threonine protein kinase